MYVAIEEGYFAEEGIDLTLVTGFGADKTMTALLTGEAAEKAAAVEPKSMLWSMCRSCAGSILFFNIIYIQNRRLL